MIGSDDDLKLALEEEQRQHDMTRGMGELSRMRIEDLERHARTFCDAYRKEFRSAQAEAEKWPGWVDGFDPGEPVDAAYLALETSLGKQQYSEDCSK